MNINELKSKWNKNKNYYQTHEKGSGVQSFVKDCLENKKIFNLKEGAPSKAKSQLRKEFIHEKGTKERRTADFVIYISSEIEIPVEVECYGNIKAGESQLFQYQKDLDKKYGILTDGYYWRFYTNNIYRSLPLNEIFKDPALLLEFWEEYIKPELYYLSHFEKIGQLELFDNPIYVEGNRMLFFEDITYLIDSFKRKLKLEGYFNGVGEIEKGKKATEITYAYIIQFILYKTLVDNKFANFEKRYEKIVNQGFHLLPIKLNIKNA